jgi:hypothetical protein
MRAKEETDKNLACISQNIAIVVTIYCCDLCSGVPDGDGMVTTTMTVLIEVDHFWRAHVSAASTLTMPS